MWRLTLLPLASGRVSRTRLLCSCMKEGCGRDPEMKIKKFLIQRFISRTCTKGTRSKFALKNQTSYLKISLKLFILFKLILSAGLNDPELSLELLEETDPNNYQKLAAHSTHFTQILLHSEPKYLFLFCFPSPIPAYWVKVFVNLLGFPLQPNQQTQQETLNRKV